MWLEVEGVSADDNPVGFTIQRGEVTVGREEGREERLGRGRATGVLTVGREPGGGTTGCCKVEGGGESSGSDGDKS